MRASGPIAILVLLLIAGCSQEANRSSAEAVVDDRGSGGPADQPSVGSSDERAAHSKDLPSAAKGKAKGLPPGALRVQMVEVIDSNGFERPLAASYGFIPVGWLATGGVQWGRQFACTNGYNVDWFAQSPDGLQAVAILPQQKWETNNYGGNASTPGCASAAISSVQQYLQQLVVDLKPGARVTGIRPRPDLAAKFQHLNRATPSPMGDMRTWVESGEAAFAYNERGRNMLGIVDVTAVFSLMRTDTGMGSTMNALTGFVFPGFAATGPEGQFNPQFAETIRQSFLPNPAWEARISNHNSAIFRSAQAEIRKQSQAITEANDYVSRIRQETYTMRAQSDERRQREFGETIKSVETYNDPAAGGGQVELSNLYNHAWRLNDGSYVLSNDAAFEPFRDIGVDGKRLEKTQ